MEFRTRCQDYINCDLCHRYVPTRFCEICAIHEEAQEVMPNATNIENYLES